MWFEENDKGIIEDITAVKTVVLQEPEAGKFCDIHDQRKWFMEKNYWPFEKVVSKEEDRLLFLKFVKAWEYYSWYRTEITIENFDIKDSANPLQKNSERFLILTGVRESEYIIGQRNIKRSI